VLHKRFLDSKHVRELLLQLCAVQLIVRSLRGQNFVLLFNGEVFPRKVGFVVLLVQLEAFVVRDNTWVGKVVNAGEPPHRHLE